MNDQDSALPDFDHVLSAAERLNGVAHRTPLARSSNINSHCGADVVFKCENLQRTGAFKFRGAFNAISRFSEKQKARGVLTYSSGNHGQAVALVGRELGVRTTVVMPENVTLAKRAAAEAYGAEVVLFDPAETTREALAERLLAEWGQTFIAPFDHPHVIAGQGTAALEFLQDEDLDRLLVPCGGGGLLSGCALAVKGLKPDCQVIGVEPTQADDATRSFRSGSLQRIESAQTIADGVRTPCLGQLTFPIIRQQVDDMQTVSEAAIKEAMRLILMRMKLLVEPSGALGLAAILEGKVDRSGKTGVLISGGNVDATLLADVVSE